MSEWYCYKCKEKMVPAEVTLAYLEIEGQAEALNCPKCGTKYISEVFVVEKLAQAEKMIEEK